MNTITFEEAACIYFSKRPTNEEKITCKAKFRIMEEQGALLCFKTDPNSLEIIGEARVYGSPNSYKFYTTEAELKAKDQEEEDKEDGEEDDDIKLVNDAQIVQFINYAFRPKIEHFDNSTYKLQYIRDDQIMSIVPKYTTVFERITPATFAKWLKSSNIDFTNQEPERTTSNNNTGTTSKLRSRNLSVLSTKYHDLIVQNIVDVLPNHQEMMSAYKEANYDVIGYCRKSKKKSENRIKLLQRMVNILKDRSCVDRVYVSPICTVKEALCKRDDNIDNEIMTSLNDVDGDTKDFLNYIKKNKTTKICVVVIDFAGLTTNKSDLKKFLINNPNVQKFVIDLFFYENKFHVFDRTQLINNPKTLNLFNCRPAYKQRSK